MNNWYTGDGMEFDIVEDGEDVADTEDANSDDAAETSNKAA